MVSVKYDGRLGNNMIQYFVSKLFAKQKNIQFNGKSTFFQSDWTQICKNTENYKNIGSIPFIVNDENFQDLFNSEVNYELHYIFDGWFQEKKFFQLHENEIKSLIELNYEEKNEDEIFIHYRLGDTINDRKMLPIEYYEEHLNSISFKTGFISSDTINHPNCIQLINKYNLTPLENFSPISTILFAKDFKKIILSEGSFSWWIGFLNKDGKIYCNERERFWHGDLFFDRWNYICWDYPKESIYDNTKLYNTKAIKLC